MLGAYIVAVVTYIFAACAGYALIRAVNHLDPPEVAPVKPEVAAAPRELKLAS